MSSWSDKHQADLLNVYSPAVLPAQSLSNCKKLSSRKPVQGANTHSRLKMVNQQLASSSVCLFAVSIAPLAQTLTAGQPTSPRSSSQARADHLQRQGSDTRTKPCRSARGTSWPERYEDCAPHAMEPRSQLQILPLTETLQPVDERASGQLECGQIYRT